MENHGNQETIPSTLLLTVSVFFVVSLFCVSFMSYKLVSVGHFVMSAATFVVPLWYLCGDMITELYGYKLTRKLIWITAFISIFFSAFLILLIHLPSPAKWRYQPYYNYIIGHILRINLSDMLGILCGGFINSIVLSKWKIFIKGRFYWFRSLCSSMIGQAVYIIIALPIIFYGMVSFKDMIEIMIASFTGKAIIILVTIWPVSFLVRLLKDTQQLDKYDYGVNYNPFKLDK